MPPIRTAKGRGRPPNNDKNGAGLSAFGFLPVTQDEARAQRAKVASTISKPSKTEIEHAASWSILGTEPPAPASHKTIKPLKLSRPVGPGLKEVNFSNNRDWEHREGKLGSKTRKLSFDSEFVLTDVHIDELIAMGPSVCRSLWSFVVNYHDPEYKSAFNLTDEAVIRLANNCPNLRIVQLQGTHHLTDRALIALFQNCPELRNVEITCTSGCRTSLKGAAFDALREKSGWGVKLKNLRIERPSDGTNEFMKAMRALSKEREKLLIRLVWTFTDKKWGDWWIERIDENYRKGRKQSKDIYRGIKPFQDLQRAWECFY